MFKRLKVFCFALGLMTGDYRLPTVYGNLGGGSPLANIAALSAEATAD